MNTHAMGCRFGQEFLPMATVEVARSSTQEMIESPNIGLHHFLNFDGKLQVSFPANLGTCGAKV